MNWEIIGIVSEVASAFAIVVTLIYLAGQNRQANIMAATNTTTKGSEMFSHWRGMIVNNAALADALLRANANEKVSLSERLQLNHWFDDFFVVAGAVDASGRQSGALHDNQTVVDYAFMVFQENPSIISRWHHQRLWMEEMSPAFVASMNEKLVAGE